MALPQEEKDVVSLQLIPSLFLSFPGVKKQQWLWQLFDPTLRSGKMPLFYTPAEAVAPVASEVAAPMVDQFGSVTHSKISSLEVLLQASQ